MNSINFRLLISTSIFLLFFFGITGIALDRVYRLSELNAFKDSLQNHIYTLIAFAELGDEGKLQMPKTLPEARYSNASAGLFGLITAKDKGVIWRSPSMVGIQITLPQAELGKGVYTSIDVNQKILLAFSFATSWVGSNDQEFAFTFHVAKDQTEFFEKLFTFRRNLWVGLGIATILLLLIQGLVLRWGLSPLRTVANELHQVEDGSKTSISGNYPNELMGLTHNINRLIENERKNLSHYRHTLDDLAHSLKTPIAVLRSLVENPDYKVGEIKPALFEQISRMNDIVSYQLKRAASSGRVTFATAVPINKEIDGIINSLNKVYADKGINLQQKIEKNCEFYGEIGDFMEVFGNILENAYKWCKKEIIVHIEQTPQQLRLLIEDDGPGIEEEMIEQITQRGVRADSSIKGHGIGLAIVKQIIESYSARIHIKKSKLGGSRFEIVFPRLS